MAKSKKRKSVKLATGEILLVGSKVRATIKSAGFNTAGNAIDGLNAYVLWLITQATKRAKANGRKTVRDYDFIITR